MIISNSKIVRREQSTKKRALKKRGRGELRPKKKANGTKKSMKSKKINKSESGVK